VPYNRNEFKLSLNTLSSNIYLHMASLSFTWYEQKSCDVKKYHVTISLRFYWVGMVAIFVYRELYLSYQNLSFSTGTRILSYKDD